MALDRACALVASAQRLRDEGKDIPALRASRRAFALFVAHDGPGSLDAANALLETSGALADLGRYPEAAACAEQVLSIVGATRAGGSVARLRHQAFLQAGHLRIFLGRYQEARRAFHRALATAERHALGADAIARSLNGLGIAAKYTRAWAAGERHYRHALHLLGGTQEADGPLAATLLHNLGGLAHARRRYPEAESWARRGLEMRTRSLGPEAVATATDLAALAAIVQARGFLDDAARLYRRAIAVLRRRLGPHHFEVLFNVCQTAVLEHARGRRARSRSLYRRALPRLEKLLGRNHPMVSGFRADARRVA